MPPTQPETYRKRLQTLLLQAAEAMIVEEGLAALQARRIAKAAACSVGTLYNIFGDLDGLILAVNERTLRDLERVIAVAAQRSATADLGTRLMALAIAYLDFAVVHARRWRAVFEHRLPDDRDVPPSYRRDRQRLLALIEAQLVSSIPDAGTRTDAAYALFASVHGIVVLSLDAKLDPFDAAQCERRIRFVVTHAVAGLE
jgi:AcrR family transcriptional regulator